MNMTGRDRTLIKFITSVKFSATEFAWIVPINTVLASVVTLRNGYRIGRSRSLLDHDRGGFLKAFFRTIAIVLRMALDLINSAIQLNSLSPINRRLLSIYLRELVENKGSLDLKTCLGTSSNWNSISDSATRP
jgi:hypothetical protein